MSSFKVFRARSLLAPAYTTNVVSPGVMTDLPGPTINMTAVKTLHTAAPICSSVTLTNLVFLSLHPVASQALVSLPPTASQRPPLSSLIASATRTVARESRRKTACTLSRTSSTASKILSRVTDEPVSGTVSAPTTTLQELVTICVPRTLSGTRTTVISSSTPITAINGQSTHPCGSAPTITALENPAPLQSATGVTLAVRSYSDSRLLAILGPIFGILALLAIRVVFSKCRAYRRHLRKRKKMARSSLPQFSGEWRDCHPMELAPPKNAFTRGSIIIRRPLSPASTYTKANTDNTHPHAGESSLSSDGQSCKVFSDSAAKLSSHTSISLTSVHSTEAVSTEIAFASDATRSTDGTINMADVESGSNTNGGSESWFTSPMDNGPSRSHSLSSPGC